MRAEINEAEDVEVAMAPLIDCVFLLLVFFLVATTLKKIEHEVPIDLPVAAYTDHTVPESADRFTISIDAGGTVRVGSRTVGPGALHEAIRARAAQDPDQPVRVNADHRAPWRSVLEVLELLQFEEMTHVRPGTAETPS